MKKLFTPKKLLLYLLIVGISVLVKYAVSDINLDVDLLRENLLNMPAVVMENIRFSRVISGDLWQVRLPYLEQRDKAINFLSVDIKRILSNDRGQWIFFGHSGTYSNDEKKASISNLTGSLNENDRTWQLSSPKLTWQEKNNTFTFPEGLSINDGEFSLITPSASIDDTRVILLQHGGVIKWSKPLKH
ncbi:MAG: hypothetical protein IJM47_03660 [Synergistaceae bacterium]|nr:hypothetical protein [Synergistaceae bacterium]